MLIKFTYVDSQTRISMMAAPCANGPTLPDLPGITVDFSDESNWPCNAPTFYGHCDDGADIEISGILAVLTQEETDAAYVAEMAQREAKLTARNNTIIDSKIERLWAAADAYTSKYISGVAIGILTIGVIQQMPKALAVSSWSSALWAEYYTRKAAMTAVGEPDLDFSSFGPMPHSVPELQAELGM